MIILTSFPHRKKETCTSTPPGISYFYFYFLHFLLKKRTKHTMMPKRADKCQAASPLRRVQCTGGTMSCPSAATIVPAHWPVVHMRSCVCVRGHPRHAGGQGQQQTVVSGAQPHRRKWLGGWAFFGGPIFQIAYGASCTASAQYSWRACHLHRLHVGRACGFRTKRFFAFFGGCC